MKIHRDLKPLVKIARRQGWTVELTRGSHLKWLPPTGWTGRDGKPVGPIITGSTPSDGRAVKNFRAHLRRAGVSTESEKS